MQLKKEYDVFIAYHGSYEADGSARTADRIYSYLTGKGIKCFYFPRSAKDAYKANIIEVMKSRLFLFVCNSGVHTDDSKRLDPKRHYPARRRRRQGRKDIRLRRYAQGRRGVSARAVLQPHALLRERRRG